jgi:5-methylcytosine-specific restriction endonuclease McrA
LPEVVHGIRTGELTLSVVAEAQTRFRREEKSDRPLNVEEKRKIVEELRETSFREAAKKLDARFQTYPKKKKLEFYASPELLEKLERLKGLLAHKNFDGDLCTLVELLVDKMLESIEKKVTPRTQEAKQEAPKEAEGRHVPAELRRAVWGRAGRKCEYVDKRTGHRCESTHALEVDHIHPFALGGATSLANLRLLCSGHNKYRGTVTFGRRESG